MQSKIDTVKKPFEQIQAKVSNPSRIREMNHETNHTIDKNTRHIKQDNSLEKTSTITNATTWFTANIIN